MPLEVLTQRNFVADFIRLKLFSSKQKQKIAFEPHSRRLKGNVGYAFYYVAELIGKPVVDFLFVITKLFFAISYG